jgi:hypothetical protein
MDDDLLREEHQEEEGDTEQRGVEVRRPEVRRVENVVLVEVEDGTAETGSGSKRSARR